MAYVPKFMPTPWNHTAISHWRWHRPEDTRPDQTFVQTNGWRDWQTVVDLVADAATGTTRGQLMNRFAFLRQHQVIRRTRAVWPKFFPTAFRLWSVWNCFETRWAYQLSYRYHSNQIHNQNRPGYVWDVWEGPGCFDGAFRMYYAGGQTEPLYDISRRPFGELEAALDVGRRINQTLAQMVAQVL